jgi:ABC-type uncharacterized transport system involved in gliding motility auxiliary subunit
MFLNLGFKNLVCIDNLSLFTNIIPKMMEEDNLIVIVSGIWAAPVIKILKSRYK